jgi:spore coat polysaccharide biosynthesis protein SpsF
MSAIAILQARMSSQRLPGKVMLEVNGKPMIYWQVQRILRVSQIAKLVVTTSIDSSDDILAKYLMNEGVEVFRGSLEDVHSRYLAVVNGNPNTDTFLRLTGDCPFTMPLLISEMLSEFAKYEYDYYSNSINPTYPDGLDVEIFSQDSFLSISNTYLSTRDKEHVTLKYRDLDLKFKIGEKLHIEDLSNLRWTVDYEEDFKFVRQIFAHFKGQELTFSMDDVLYLLKREPHLNTQLPGSLRNIALMVEGEEIG